MDVKHTYKDMKIKTVTINLGDKIYHITDDGGDGLCIYVERPNSTSTLTVTDGRGLTYSGMEELFVGEKIEEPEEEGCCH